uniref:Forkhead box protein N1 n=1 Tax=Cacopsylla melanoneura TaxID=428564 RepID=A0A8D8RKV9_9HEMI
MDVYLSAEESLTLQEILDTDIKCELDSVWTGGSGEEFGFTHIDYSDENSCSNMNNLSWHAFNSSNLDLIEGDDALMVNLNSVIPLSLQPQSKIKIEMNEIKLEENPLLCRTPSPNRELESNVTKVEVKQEPVLPAPVKIAVSSIPTHSPVQYRLAPAPGTNAVTIAGKTYNVSNQFELINNTLVPTKQNTLPTNIIRTLTKTQKVVSIAKKPTKRKYTDRRTLAMQKFQAYENNYPKPAYSYSCLIAMALKNSRSGSLPVSEIYSFMCQHFPYFKTAPSGWKNSVRHNLSLNKCFEKIEKPVSDNSSRKGCLWAMNPEKISKMDEEVQKWSKKDPQGIKKAMVYPETLESLERGEMKIGSLSYDGSVEEDETEEEEDGEVEERIMSTTESEDDDEENELVLPYIPGDSESEGETSLDIETTDKFYEEIDVKDSTILFQSVEDTSAIKRAIIQGNYIYQPLIKQRKIIHSGYSTQTVVKN